MKWFDNVPLPMLIFLAVFLLIAPITPEPHLVQKYNMAMEGKLTEPLDIFDVFWHFLGVILVIVKLKRGTITPDDRDDR
ncbi:MAG: hypothetical protein OQJ97_11930 [Rhodospirillales bacterium]|nr:hypothetical protein [Rhodospirillales bacterium]